MSALSSHTLAMSVTYHCPHTQAPHPPYPPSYPSSSSSFSPLPSLFFCEECDSIRCDQCVAIEIASYFCPNCLFDVPSANVRADRNRSAEALFPAFAKLTRSCARSCFSCPSCSSALQTIATETVDPSSSGSTAGPPFLLYCPGCKWSSKEVGLEFEKGTGIACRWLLASGFTADSSSTGKDQQRDRGGPERVRSDQGPLGRIRHILKSCAAGHQVCAGWQTADAAYLASYANGGQSARAGCSRYAQRATQEVRGG